MSADEGNESISRNSSWKNKCIALISQLETKSCTPDYDETTVDLMKKQKSIEDAIRTAELKIKETEKLIEETSLNSNSGSCNRHILRLYEIISKLQWDYDCPSTQIRGIVMNKTLKKFNLDITLFSEHAVVNHLWSLIDSEDL
ncbi:kinetochore protein Spc24-like [Stegodyphus dumicola]|uniref:kinetochore protein Spc24-like n=1 Tax=Stegodyphus dumicola TaxID=202533 RepID=UPI0015ABAB29|nr:kinetochore protein Spc24-like [Stegodyphus dumicola]